MFQPGWWRELIGEHGGDSDAVDGTPVAAHFEPGPLLLAWASQTGVAEDLAGATREQLMAAGIAVDEVEFGKLTLARLGQARQVLFIASTTCDGDPPDMAEAFCTQSMQHPAALAHLHYGLLALGDRGYDDFCGFGRRLDEWLGASGAQAWFPRIEVDDEDAVALDRWHRQLGALATTAIPTP